MKSGMRICPLCGGETLPEPSGELTTAVCCQDPECRAVVETDGRVIWRFTDDYELLERVGEEVAVA